MEEKGEKTLLFVCLLALCNLTLFAQGGKHSRVVHTPEKSAIHVPPQETPASLKMIYSNLGTKTGLYLDSSGWELSGPNSYKGSDYAYSIAMPFTPKSNSRVSQVRAAVQYAGFGVNQINLSVYGDAGGIPGTLLAGPVTVTNLPDSGTCCALAVANFTPVAVTGGTQYWVVANTPLTGTGSNFIGGWDTIAKVVFFAGSNGVNGWGHINTDLLPAGEVLGTIP